MYATTVLAQYSNEIKIDKLLKTDSTEAGQHISLTRERLFARKKYFFVPQNIPPAQSSALVRKTNYDASYQTD